MPTAEKYKQLLEQSEADTNPDKVIHTLDEANLIAAGLLKIQGGKRHISTTTVGSSSDMSNVSTDSAIDFTELVPIPDHLYSIETYEWLGFETSMASDLMKAWQDMPADGKAPDGPYSFEDIATLRIEAKSEIDLKDTPSNWADILKQLGINEDLREIICLPQHEPLLVTAPMRYWLVEVVSMRMNLLEKMWEESRARLRRIQHNRKRDPSFSEADEYKKLLLRGGGKSQSENSQTLLKPEDTPGTVTLWRGGDKEPMEKFLRLGGIAKLQSRWPSDFRGLGGPILYFALEKEVAMRYRDFAKHTAYCTATAVMWMKVSNSFIARYESCVLRQDKSVTGKWIADDWKRIVYASRRGEHLPKDLSHLESCPILIGHICKSHNMAIAALPGWQDISHKRHVWNLRGLNEDPYYATQYVFNGTPVIKALEAEAEFGWLGEAAKTFKEEEE